MSPLDLDPSRGSVVSLQHCGGQRVTAVLLSKRSLSGYVGAGWGEGACDSSGQCDRAPGAGSSQAAEPPVVIVLGTARPHSNEGSLPAPTSSHANRSSQPKDHKVSPQILSQGKRAPTEGGMNIHSITRVRGPKPLTLPGRGNPVLGTNRKLKLLNCQLQGAMGVQRCREVLSEWMPSQRRHRGR